MTTRPETEAADASTPKPANVSMLMGGGAIGLAVLLLSGYALSTTRLFTFGPWLALGLCLLLLAFGLGTHRLHSRPDDPRIWVWMVLIFGILVSAVFDKGHSPLKSALGLAAFVTCGFFLTLMIDRHTFLRRSIAAMDWIALIGIAATVAVVYGGLHLPLSGIENSNGVTYLNGYVFFLIEANGSLLPKALGVFWEPGLFASFLVFACLIELTLMERPVNRWRVALYVAGILLTQSTAAYLLLVPVMFVAFFRSKRKRAGLAFAASLIGCILVYQYVGQILHALAAYQPTVFGKLDDGGFFTETRWNSLLVNLRIFTESPFVGMGGGGASEAFSSSMSVAVRAQTTTSGFFLAALGMCGSIYTFAWVWGVSRLGHISVYARVWFTLCLLIIVNTEPHMTILFTYCLIFYLLAWGLPSSASTGFSNTRKAWGQARAQPAPDSRRPAPA